MIRCKRRRRVSKFIILFIVRGEARWGVAGRAGPRGDEQSSSRHSYTTPESQCRQQLWLGRRQRFDVAPCRPGTQPAPRSPSALHSRPDGLLRPPKQQQKTRKHSTALRAQQQRSSRTASAALCRTFAITFVFVNAIADHISVAVAEGPLSPSPPAQRAARPVRLAVRSRGPPSLHCQCKSHRSHLITSTMYLHLNCKQRHFVIVSHSMGIRWCWGWGWDCQSLCRFSSSAN